ncbi:bis(5-nucleosyl)-tetraphosphatase [Neofusicoccum parvum]|uniref:Myb-like domain-containing protein n=2 Tax=Neofusicoccum parvum TaxID=310453 RepID=R1GBJ6_BOTPV|nr:hypothetical protein UCRNP2_7723 [Neofusicoccum parvum UCRNP2]GME24723.1 bis(5-nucleosyl)-tetraphosphatase [Neofusicoccum parvum]GME38038.1 bis(5-nucleosyl)-tetraphosphatase [Neofusicoccum parvum]
MPALTYSQASPASDLEDLSSSYPGEHHAHADHRSNEHCRQRNPRPRAEGHNRFGTLPSQTRRPLEWGPPPHARKGDSRATIEGKKKDKLLVKWKRAGMSYRQIRDKGGFTEAESTLRGRYRTLTKNREERVRKPLWMAEDVHLLREGVKMLMAGSLYPGVDAAALDVDEMDVDASKVPWRKVADYIFEHGGSYHFGNATCKKQWLKIQGMQ